MTDEYQTIRNAIKSIDSTIKVYDNEMPADVTNACAIRIYDTQTTVLNGHVNKQSFSLLFRVQDNAVGRILVFNTYEQLCITQQSFIISQLNTLMRDGQNARLYEFSVKL